MRLVKGASKETPNLVPLMSQLARLTSPRSEEEARGTGLGLAYKKIKHYADRHGLDEKFCDKVMLILLTTQADERVVAA